MLKNLNIEKSILDDLSDEDKNEIYYDYLLQKKKYEFHYIVDANEVYDYCQPFSNNKNIDLGKVADDQFIIEYLFNYKDWNVIFIEDYLSELLALRDFILSSLNAEYNNEKIIKYKETLIELFEIFKKKEKDKNGQGGIEEILFYYSFLFSISNGSYKSDLRKFNYLLSNPIIYEALKKSKIEEYSKFFKKDNKLINNLFNENKLRYYSYKTDLNAILKTYNYSNLAIERNEKKIFYFLSTSTKNNEKIINLVENDIEKYNLPFESFSLIRSKKQLFAQLIYNSIDKSDEIVSYDEYYETLNKVINDYTNDDNKFKNLIGKLAKLRSHNREIIENLTVLNARRTEMINSKKGKGIVNLETENFERILRINNKSDKEYKIIKEDLIQMIKKVNSDLDFKVEDELKNINKIIKHSLFENDALSHFFDNLSKQKEVEFDRGDDPIEHVFSAFPLILNFSFYEKEIFPFLLKMENEKFEENQLTSLNDLEISKSTSLLPYITYLLLIVRYKHHERNYSSNFLAFDYIRDLIEENKKGCFRLSDQKLADIYAIGCWAARRSRKYKFAYNLSITAKSKFKNDPRFDFSLALIGYSWQYEVETLKRYEWKWEDNENEKKENVIKYCLISIKKFKKLENFNNTIIEHSYMSLLNLTSFSYFVVYKEVFDNVIKKKEIDVQDIEDVTLNLEKADYYIKELCGLLDNKDFSKFPEYIHTQSYINLYQYKTAYLLENENELTENKKKIIHAIKILKKVTNNDNNLCRKGVSKRCKSLLNKLKLTQMDF